MYHVTVQNLSKSVLWCVKGPDSIVPKNDKILHFEYH